MAKRRESRLPVRIARYESPAQFHRELGLWVSGAGFFQGESGPDYVNDRRLGEYAAVWISHGRGWFECPYTGRQDVRAGDVMLVFPDVPHSYCSQDGPWTEQWVIFGGTMVERIERQGLLDPRRPVVSAGNEVARIFGQLQDIFIKGGPLSVPIASGLTYQLLFVLHGIASGLRGGTEDPVTARAVKIIETEALADLTPEALARRVHVGYSTLRRRFKRQTGCSVKEYMQRIRLGRAKELLATTLWPVEEVAAESGFGDVFHFSRTFRQHEGIPPSEFRRQQYRTGR